MSQRTGTVGEGKRWGLTGASYLVRTDPANLILSVQEKLLHD